MKQKKKKGYITQQLINRVSNQKLFQAPEVQKLFICPVELTEVE